MPRVRTRVLAAAWTVVGLVAGLVTMGCGDAPSEAAVAPRSLESYVSDIPHQVAVLQIRDMGEIHIQLLPEHAPNTVANFIELANEHFYDGTIFHRVVPDFMIQGGDPNSKDNDPRDDGKGGPDYYIDDEPNPLPHLRGVVSMANKGREDTAGSQFFIVHGDSEFLNGQHTAFGRVIEGMDVVDAIAKLEIDTYGRYGPADRPYPKQAVIEAVRIEGSEVVQVGG